MPHQTLDGVLKSLELDDYVVLTKGERQEINLSSEALEICQNGTPEWRVLQALIESGTTESVAKDKLAQSTKMAPGLINVAAGKLAKLKWAKADKVGIAITPEGSEAGKNGTDEDAILLKRMSEDSRPETYSSEEINRMKKRKAVKVEKINYYEIKKGTDFRTKRVKLVAELTQEMLKNNSWEGVEFKALKLDALGKLSGTGGAVGSLHPLLQMREQFR